MLPLGYLIYILGQIITHEEKITPSFNEFQICKISPLTQYTPTCTFLPKEQFQATILPSNPHPQMHITLTLPVNHLLGLCFL